MTRPPRSPSRLRLEPLEDRCLLDAAPFNTLPVVPVINPATKVHLQSILDGGLALGNRADIFSKVGDSITATPDFLTQMGAPSYNPANPVLVGTHTNLANTINYFRPVPVDGSGADSFDHVSWAAAGGWQSGSVFDPAFNRSAVQAGVALPGETPLGTELRLTRPAFALIMLGTNDTFAGIGPDLFRQRMAAIVALTEQHGVIPVLSTIPDMLYNGGAFEPLVLAYNQVIADVAADLDVPLWNYWLALQGLPLQGLDQYGIHPSTFPSGSGVIADVALSYGYNMRNYTAMLVLDKLLRVVAENGAPDLTPIPLSPAVVTLVTDLYGTLLHRAAAPAEVSGWGLPLEWGVASRQQVAQGIWDSAEHRAIEVVQYYQTYLHRTPGPGEVAGWVTDFLQGASEEQVQVGFLTSAEYEQEHAGAAAYVTALYQDVLGRAPDAGGLASAEQALQVGVSPGVVARTVLTSVERAQQVIMADYRAFLRRTPDPSEVQLWLPALLVGETLEGIGEGILGSVEYWTLPQ